MADTHYNNVYVGNAPATITKTIRAIVDGNTDVFRYGLHRYARAGAYEDPTILGFTFELDEESSPLFKDLPRFLNEYGSKYPEVDARRQTLEQLWDAMRQFFMSQESVVDPAKATAYIKSHYINSVAGLTKLQSKFVKYLEDKLTLTLHEDIGLLSSHFMALHRNTEYGFATGHDIIPNHLLKFVLRIKISEIRNLTSINHIMQSAAGNTNSKKLVKILRNNTSCIVYTLWDCHLDAFAGYPHEDEIVQAGMNASAPEYSTNKVDIYYKSVSRYIRSTLNEGAFSMDDVYPDLGISVVNDRKKKNLKQEPDPNKTTLAANSSTPDDGYQEGLTTDFSMPSSPGSFSSAGVKKSTMTNSFLPQQNTLATPLSLPNVAGALPAPAAPVPDDSDQGDDDSGIAEWIRQKAEAVGVINPPKDVQGDGGIGLAMGYEPQSLLERLEKKLTSSVNQLVEAADRKLAQARSELVRTFLTKVETFVGIKKITPENVYEGSQETNAFDQLAGDIGFALSDEIFSALV